MISEYRTGTIVAMTADTPINVFISSTCNDLMDLRSEVYDSLRQQGFHVRVSENIKSSWEVEPDEETMATCLKNVEESDVIVVILDRRYGWNLPPTYPEYGGKSATHGEILHAQRLKKRLIYFIRERALADYHSLDRDIAHPTQWVELGNADQAKKWHALVKSLYDNPDHAGTSKWLETFKVSTDLKGLILASLLKMFPKFAGAIAMLPDHLVRLTLREDYSSPGQVTYYLANVGIGPALNIQAQFYVSVLPNKTIKTVHIGGLAERDGRSISFQIPDNYSAFDISLRCRYENRFGDKYQLELKTTGSPNQRIASPEEFFVWQPDDTDGKWVIKA